MGIELRISLTRVTLPGNERSYEAQLLILQTILFLRWDRDAEVGLIGEMGTPM